MKDAELRMQKVGSSGNEVKAPFVTGLHSSVMITAEATESGPSGADNYYKTSASGEYHIILGLLASGRATDPDPDAYAATIDRSKMKWQKRGYVISPK